MATFASQSLRYVQSTLSQQPVTRLSHSRRGFAFCYNRYCYYLRVVWLSQTNTERRGTRLPLPPSRGMRWHRESPSAEQQFAFRALPQSTRDAPSVVNAVLRVTCNPAVFGKLHAANSSKGKTTAAAAAMQQLMTARKGRVFLNFFLDIASRGGNYLCITASSWYSIFQVYQTNTKKY